MDESPEKALKRLYDLCPNLKSIRLLHLKRDGVFLNREAINFEALQGLQLENFHYRHPSITALDLLTSFRDLKSLRVEHYRTDFEDPSSYQNKLQHLYFSPDVGYGSNWRRFLVEANLGLKSFEWDLTNYQGGFHEFAHTTPRLESITLTSNANCDLNPRPEIFCQQLVQLKQLKHVQLQFCGAVRTFPLLLDNCSKLRTISIVDKTAGLEEMDLLYDRVAAYATLHPKRRITLRRNSLIAARKLKDKPANLYLVMYIVA